MTAQRFEELLQQLLDGELAPADGDVLATELQANPERRRELRQHLILWELWAQHRAPERSAEAFLAACQTRLRAERQGEVFVAGVEQRIRADGLDEQTLPSGTAPKAGRGAGVFHWWQALQQPGGALWAAVSVIAVAAVIWLALPRPAQALTTVRGEAVCTACMLHETHEHLPAIRVHDGGRTHIYYVSSDPTAVGQLGNYCMAPIRMVATGRAETKNGRTVFAAQTVESAPGPDPRESILFPF